MRIRDFFAVLALTWAGAASAQEASVEPEQVPEAVAAQQPTIMLQTQILTVDIERLFAQSRFGQRVSQELRAEQEALSQENRRLAEALRAEELDLADRRPEMDPETFRAEAEAFDEKVVAIRAAQDARERDLEQAVTQSRETFFEATRPVLGQLMLDSGASVILDRRSVLVSLGAIDVTDAAISRIDAAIGDGSDVSPGEPLLPVPDPNPAIEPDLQPETGD